MPSFFYKIHLLWGWLFNITTGIPSSIQQAYFRMCEYNYVPVGKFGEIPIQRVAISNINSHYIKTGVLDIPENESYTTCVINVLPPLEDYAKGFIDGYNKNFTPFIDTIEGKKETVLNSALKNHRSFLTTHIGDEIEFHHLYDDGLYEGERYKAWEIILQTPNAFCGYIKGGIVNDNSLDIVGMNSGIKTNEFAQSFQAHEIGIGGNGNDAENSRIETKKQIKDYFKYNKNNENYIATYLSEISSVFDLKEKGTLGAVCLAIYEKKAHDGNKIKCFSKFVELLSEHWSVDPPKDKRPTKYTARKNTLKQRYSILDGEIK